MMKDMAERWEHVDSICCMAVRIIGVFCCIFVFTGIVYNMPFRHRP